MQTHTDWITKVDWVPEAVHQRAEELVKVEVPPWEVVPEAVHLLVKARELAVVVAQVEQLHNLIV